MILWSNSYKMIRSKTEIKIFKPILTPTVNNLKKMRMTMKSKKFLWKWLLKRKIIWDNLLVPKLSDLLIKNKPTCLKLLKNLKNLKTEFQPDLLTLSCSKPSTIVKGKLFLMQWRKLNSVLEMLSLLKEMKVIVYMSLNLDNLIATRNSKPTKIEFT